MKREETEGTFVKEYCIEGTVKFDGNEESISETVEANSSYLAFKYLAKRLRRERKQLIEFYKCRIRTVKVFIPKSPLIKPIKKKERREEQLEIFKMHNAP